MRMRMIVLILLLMLFAVPLAAQEPDSDGDTVPDRLDYCYQIAGDPNLFGCTPDLLPDLDGDGTPDPLDTCIGEVGLADNFGCPAGVVPDLDRDGIPDAVDQCRTEFAETESGCLPDRDGDAIPDNADGCPDQAGDPNLQNFGCPEGVAPEDSDGDTVPNIFDSCPDVAGTPELGGCNDADGDGTPDNIDQCPDVAGDSMLFGCVSVTETTLPTTLVPITTANAAQVTEVARLTVGLPRIAVGIDGTLAVRSSDNLLIYNMADAPLAPRAEVVTGWSGYPVAVGAGSTATFELPADFADLPYIQVRDASGAPISRIEATEAVGGEALGIASLHFHPSLPVLAVAQTPLSGMAASVPAPILLHDVLAGSVIGELPATGGAINLAFSGDGSRIAADTVENGTIRINVWDFATRNLVSSFDTGLESHFIGAPMALNDDGSLAVVGYPDGTVNVWLIGETPTKLATIPVFDASTDQVVSAVAFSPDGSLVAVSGGVPFSGGLSGAEEFPVSLIDVGSGQIIGVIGTHESLPRELSFTADGRLLISAGDSTVRFWGVG